MLVFDIVFRKDEFFRCSTSGPIKIVTISDHFCPIITSYFKHEHIESTHQAFIGESLGGLWWNRSLEPRIVCTGARLQVLSLAPQVWHYVTANRQDI